MTEENNSQEPDFETLLRESEAKSRTRVEVGQKLEGTVVQIGKTVVHVDIGMRSEVILPREDDARIEALKEGDLVEAFVVATSPEITLGLDPVLGFGDFSVLEDAAESNSPVEGKVEAARKGGFTINVSGVSCFCPISQIDDKFVEDTSPYVGQTFSFRVLEVNPGRNDAVLSRRALLVEEKQRLIQEARKQIVPGAVLKGRVVDMRDFGAFVDLGGLQGMIHISELAHQKVARVEDALSLDQEVEVKVLDLSKDAKGRDRISLSRRALLPDPWAELNPQQGQAIKGRVVRKASYGIFINLHNSVDGLMPLRFMKRSGRNLSLEDFEIGDEIDVVITETNPQDKRITLGLPGWDEEIVSQLKPGDVFKASVVKIIPAGMIVQGLDDPAKGLVHRDQLKGLTQKQLFDRYPVGSELEVALENVDEKGRYNFRLHKETSEVDRSTMEKYTDNEDDLGHNPFASFFKDQ